MQQSGRSHRVLEIDGRSLTLSDVEDVARRRIIEFSLTPQARQRMDRSRQRVLELIEADATVYGVNTGFGHFASVRVDHHRLHELQLNLVRSHAAGTGEILPAQVVRPLMLLRANVLGHGNSGVRPLLVDHLLELLSRDILPLVPRQGSVGASGDLVPLAHVALLLIGEGKAWVEGELVGGAQALERAGLEPVRLQAKEGLALLNGTQLMTSLGTLTCRELEDLCVVADIAGALCLEALAGQVSAFDPVAAALRPHQGQIDAAEHLVSLLEGSELADRADQQKVQDAYSLRCMPQVHGASRDVCRVAREILEVEINSVTDNPVILDDGRVVACGNFHGQPVAFALDWLAIAACDLASISERRINRMVNPNLSGLPAFLVVDGGLRSGLLMTQTVAAALVSESRGLAVPASTDNIPTSADQEDHVSMGAWGGWKAWQAVANCRRVLAIELLCAREAMKLQAPALPAPKLRRAIDWLDQMVAPLTADRPLAGDIRRLDESLLEGELLRSMAAK
ncbi:MAG: histidine ammonia-lyase [Acidobacteriota bacterium]